MPNETKEVLPYKYSRSVAEPPERRHESPFEPTVLTSRPLCQVVNFFFFFLHFAGEKFNEHHVVFEHINICTANG